MIRDNVTDRLRSNPFRRRQSIGDSEALFHRHQIRFDISFLVNAVIVDRDVADNLDSDSASISIDMARTHHFPYRSCLYDRGCSCLNLMYFLQSRLNVEYKLLCQEPHNPFDQNSRELFYSLSSFPSPSSSFTQNHPKSSFQESITTIHLNFP